MEEYQNPDGMNNPGANAPQTEEGVRGSTRDTSSLMVPEKDPEFFKMVKEEYKRKHAKDALLVYEEFKKVEKAYNFYKGIMQKLEEGDYTVLEKYRKERRRLETEDGYEF